MSEPRETNRNGKRSRGTSPSTNNNTSSKTPNAAPAESLTPETSDDDNRKQLRRADELPVTQELPNSFSDSKKNLGKPKNGKSEFEGEFVLWGVTGSGSCVNVNSSSEIQSVALSIFPRFFSLLSICNCSAHVMSNLIPKTTLNLKLWLGTLQNLVRD